MWGSSGSTPQPRRTMTSLKQVHARIWHDGMCLTCSSRGSEQLEKASQISSRTNSASAESERGEVAKDKEDVLNPLNVQLATRYPGHYWHGTAVGNSHKREDEATKGLNHADSDKAQKCLGSVPIRPKDGAIHGCRDPSAFAPQEILHCCEENPPREHVVSGI